MKLFLLLIFCKIIETIVTNNSNRTCLNELIRNEFNDRDAIVVADNFRDVQLPNTAVYLIESANFRRFLGGNFKKSTSATNLIINLGSLQLDGEVFRLANIQTKTLLIVDFVGEIDANHIKNLFATAWKSGLTRFVLAVNDGDSPKLYSRNPQCFCNVDEIIESSCNESSGDLFEIPRRFPNGNCDLKTVYLHGPPFVIDVNKTKNPGVMVSLVRTISEKSGVSLNFDENSWMFDDELLNNGTYWKLRQYFLENRADLAIGHLFMNDTKTNPYNYGATIYSDSLSVIVPMPKRLKTYRKLLKIFTKDTWMKLLQIIALTFAIYLLLSLIIGERIANFFHILFDIVRISLGNAVKSQPLSISLRILFFAYSLFALNIDSIYLGKLSSVLSTANYDTRIVRLVMFKEKDLHCFSSWRNERLVLLLWVFKLYNANVPLYHVVNRTEDDMYIEVFTEQKVSTFGFDSLRSSYPTGKLVTDLFMMDNYLTFFVAPYLSKTSPFNLALDFWINEIFERGLTLKWFNDIALSNVNASLLPPIEKKVVVLQLAHFEEIFLFLGYGYCLASMALILEFAWKWIDDHTNLRRNFISLISLLKPPKLNSNQIVV